MNLLIPEKFFLRHILASLHFNENENLQRETQRVFNGKEYTWVTYPKFKMGEEVVWEVACPPTYGKNKYDYSGLTLIYKKTTWIMF